MSGDIGLLNRFFVVPHTHWDREWYSPFEHFHLRLAEVVDGVIDVLERDPDFTAFTLDGQAIVLEDYLAIRPQNEGRLRALMSAGRIEVGPSYMLPDEFLVGAEPLVRNLLIGRAVCRRLGAEPSVAGYMPDSFGHPEQLPQILAGFGIESFIFSRGMGDELDEVGLVFRWTAPDGSSVLAFQQLPHYDNFAHVRGIDDAEDRVRRIAERFGPALERAGVHEVLLCNGSDHLPVQAELPRWCVELEQRFPGTRFAISRYAEYVQAAAAVHAPAWSGELLGSRMQNVLRGVNSARLYLKQANEQAEQRLLAVETLTALRALQDGEAFPVADFRFAWSELLRCQPHDSICGCSCDEVHRDMMVRYGSLERTLTFLRDRALSVETSSDGATRVSVINVLPERRRGLIEVPGAEPAIVDVDGFSARAVELTLAAAPPQPGGAGTAIESERFRVEAAPDGTMTLLDKADGRRFEKLHALEDEPDMGDLYNFCPIEGARHWRSEHARVCVLADGPVVWELEVCVDAELPAGLDGELRPLRDTVTLGARTVVRLVQGSARIEFRTTIDNPARNHRLRVTFPTGPAVGPVRAEGQFALVRRPLAPRRPRADWCEPPDGTQHTCGAVALGPIALLTKGLPEYEARAGDAGAELCLTLLRAVGIISRRTGEIATRPQSAGPQLATPEGQCLGRYELEYALRLDADELGDAELLRSSQDYRRGLVVVPGVARLAPSLALEGDVVFSCLKGAEDGEGVILRCFNPAGVAASAAVVGPVTAARARLDETGEHVLPDGRLELGPGEIATLRLRLS
jgi:mannosylglycerate hydrolase